MLKVLDIGIGNIGSVTNALQYLRFDFSVVKSREELSGASKLILPGVGSFDIASNRIMEANIKGMLREKVLGEKIPILGICLGMQLLLDFGYENGKNDGLGLVAGQVRKIIIPDDSRYLLPHMGWNDVMMESKTPLFDKIKDKECFYFVHSYECLISDSEVQIGYTDYGRNITAAFSKNNIHGVQFHPEKSQAAGLQILRNFVERC